MSVWSLTTWSILLTFFHKIRLFDRIEIFSAAACLTALWVRSKEEGHQLKYCNMPVIECVSSGNSLYLHFPGGPILKYIWCVRYNFLRFTYSFISQLIDLGFEASATWCYPPTILLYFTRIRGAFRKSGGEAIGYNSLTINIIDTF